MASRPMRDRKPRVDMEPVISYAENSSDEDNVEDSQESGTESEKENSSKKVTNVVPLKSPKNTKSPKSLKSPRNAKSPKPVKSKVVKDLSAKKTVASKKRVSTSKQAVEDVDNFNESIEEQKEHEFESLWIELSRPHVAIKTVVTHVISKLSSKNANEVYQMRCDLVNLLFEMCDSTLPPFTVSELDSQDKQKLVKKAASFTRKEPALPDKTKKQRHFIMFAEFCKKFTDACDKKELIFENNETSSVISYLIDWLVEISLSTITTFRFAATNISYDFMTSLIGSLKNRLNRVQIINAQIGGENGKQNARIKSLESELKIVASQIKEIEALMESIFENIFVARYRDTSSILRETSITLLGKWSMMLPSVFLKDQYLKYIGWSLSDKESTVRLASLKCVLDAFAEKSNHEALSSFTTRFLDRFGELCRDSDNIVCARAIDLATSFLRAGLLGEGDLLFIPSLMFDSSIEVRKAAGRFVYEDCFVTDDEVRDKTSQLTQLLNVMSDASPEICELDVASYQIVQSLWDHLPALQDWECLTEFLLKSESLPTKGKRKAQTDHVELSEIQQTFLAYILSACAQHCMPMVVVEYMEPEYVKNAKTLPILSIEQKESATKFTKYFTKQLPELLTVYQADNQKLTALSNLARFLDVEAIEKQRQLNLLELLLKCMKTIFLKQSDQQILSSIAASFAHFLKSGDSKDDLFVVVSELAGELTSAFSEVCDSGELENLGADKRAAFVITMKRINILAHHVYLEELDCFSTFHTELSSLLSSQLTNEDFNEEIVSLCLDISFGKILWCSQKMEDSSFLNRLDQEVDFAENFVVSLKELIPKATGHVLFKSLQVSMDLACIFNPRLRTTNMNLFSNVVGEDFAKCLSSSLQSLLPSLLEAESMDEAVLDTLFSGLAKLGSYCPKFFKDVVALGLSCFVFLDELPRCELLVKSMVSNIKKDTANTKLLSEVFASALTLFSEDNELESLQKKSRKLAKEFGAKDDCFDLARRVIDYSFEDTPNRFKILDSALESFLNKASSETCRRILNVFMENKNSLSGSIEKLELSYLEDFQEKLKILIKKDKKGPSVKSRPSNQSSKRLSVNSVISNLSPMRVPTKSSVVSPAMTLEARVAQSVAALKKRKLPDIEESDKESVADVDEDEMVQEQPKLKISKPSRYKPVLEDAIEEPEDAIEEPEDDDDLQAYKSIKKGWSKSTAPQDDIED